MMIKYFMKCIYTLYHQSLSSFRNCFHSWIFITVSKPTKELKISFIVYLFMSFRFINLFSYLFRTIEKLICFLLYFPLFRSDQLVIHLIANVISIYRRPLISLNFVFGNINWPISVLGSQGHILGFGLFLRGGLALHRAILFFLYDRAFKRILYAQNSLGSTLDTA